MRWELLENGIRVLAPAKLNLYLEVGVKRPDGYHEIDSIFQSISLHDELEYHPAGAGQIRLEEEGIAAGEANLVLRAARALQERAREGEGSRPGARIRLRKGIPEGAGLGGGSSDAAATLLALTRLWKVRIGFDELAALAAQLGSDVPFFLTGGTCRCQGRGERVTSWGEAFDAAEPWHYVLVYPRLKIPTSLAYKALDDLRGPDFTLTPPSPLDSMPPAIAWKQLRGGKLFFNRFEAVVYPAYPELRAINAVMCEQPFLQVLLSGSGSAMYGLCRGGEEAARLGAELGGKLEADVFTVQSERRGAGLAAAMAEPSAAPRPRSPPSGPLGRA